MHKSKSWEEQRTEKVALRPFGMLNVFNRWNVLKRTRPKRWCLDLKSPDWFENESNFHSLEVYEPWRDSVHYACAQTVE